MINKIKQLAGIAMELGGTTYEIAQEGGLLSALCFLERHVKSNKPNPPENVKLVTEVFVRFADREEPDRVFLYTDDMRSDKELLEEGCIQEGKLVIAYERLETLAAKGYKCIYNRAEDGHNGRSFAYYHLAFGENKMMVPFKMWDSSAFFMGNGHNRALFVTTKFERLFVMPDMYAVRESIRVVCAENLIRERHDVRFNVERMRWKKETGTLPEEYGKLYQQKAYIKANYPEEYEAVWNKKKQQSVADEKVSVGICMDYCRTFGVCRMPDGTMRRIPNTERDAGMSNDRKYEFGGYKKFFDPDTAIANLPGILRNIITSTEMTYQVTVDKIYVTVVDNALSASLLSGDSAMMEADLPEIEYVDYYAAVMNAYSGAEAIKHMKENETALFYDFSELRVAPALIEKLPDGTFRLVHRVEREDPEEYIFSEEDDFSYVYKNTFQDVYEDEFGEPMVPGLREIMWSDMDHFMLDAGLREIGVADRKPANKKAFDRMHGDWGMIKKQLQRNNSAPIRFDNGYLSITMDYPIGRFEKCFAPILKNADAALDALFAQAGISKEEISAVILAGENSEYPFVQKRLEQYTGKKADMVNMPECVAARGAVLHQIRE